MTSVPLSFTKTVKKKQRSFELPAPTAPLADTHAHLTCFWNKTPAEALARAARAGVCSLVTLWDPIADDFDSFPAFRAWLAEQLAAARERAERDRFHEPGIPGALPASRGAYRSAVRGDR